MLGSQYLLFPRAGRQETIPGQQFLLNGDLSLDLSFISKLLQTFVCLFGTVLRDGMARPYLKARFCRGPETLFFIPAKPCKLGER